MDSTLWGKKGSAGMAGRCHLCRRGCRAATAMGESGSLALDTRSPMGLKCHRQVDSLGLESRALVCCRHLSPAVRDAPY